MTGVDEERLLVAVLEALPFAAAVVTRRGDVIAKNARFQQRAGTPVVEPGLVEVAIGVSGHRLLFAREASSRAVAVQAVVKRYSFTKREAEVLEHLLEALSSRTIAARLVLGVRTVESHIARLLEKSECESRAEFIARVLQTLPRAER